MIRRHLSSFVISVLIAVVAMAIWKANGHDAGRVVHGALGLLDHASDWVVVTWHQIAAKN